MVALSKADLTEVREAYPALQSRFRQELDVELHLLSTVTGEGVGAVTAALAAIALSCPTPSDPDADRS